MYCLDFGIHCHKHVLCTHMYDNALLASNWYGLVFIVATYCSIGNNSACLCNARRAGHRAYLGFCSRQNNLLADTVNSP